MDPDLLDLSELRIRHVDEGRPLPREVERALTQDPRAAARALLAAVARRRRANRSEGQRLRKMLRYEREHWSTGTLLVAGCDEAGMSPLAGPVVAAAVILPVDCRIVGCDDSKKLAPELRESLAPVIKEQALAWSVAHATPTEIDEINIYHAGLLAMRRALEALAPVPEVALIDGKRLPFGKPGSNGHEPPMRQVPLVRGDGLSLSIAAASVLAKTSRDALMVEMDARYPGYGFAQHKGYPVRQHREAIRRLGLLPIHRRSFPALYRALGTHAETLTR